MNNQIFSYIIKTTITGAIEGKDVIVDFENKSGVLPTSVNAFCKIVYQNGAVCEIVINVGAVGLGSKTITVTGAITEDRTTLIAGMKSRIEAILING